MATFKIWNINQRMGKRINYICQDGKTENGKYISSLNCPSDPAACTDQMKATKTRFHKETGVLLYHAVQSFKPGELTPEDVCCKRCFLRTPKNSMAAIPSVAV